VYLPTDFKGETRPGTHLRHNEIQRMAECVEMNEMAYCPKFSEEE